MRELLTELMAALDAGRPCVWCLVAETRGSTPQKAGAAMLVFPDGSQRGTLGGGCVEAEVKQRALRALASSGPAEVFTFALDDNYGWDDGLICGGRMTILAQPLPALNARTYFAAQQALVNGGRGCTEAIVVGEVADTPAGSRYLFDGDGVEVARLTDPPPGEDLLQNLVSLRQRPAAYLRGGVAFLPVLPRITILLVGGGHVGQAVARLASDVGFDTWVLDDRESYASAERFPLSARRMVGDIGTTLKEIAPTLGPDFYALILTRGHSHDEEALYHLAETACGYVGMIGSRRKIRLIFEDLLAKGISSEAIARVHAPLGVPIGSLTVPEIAISIVAELIARRNLGTTAVSPRDRIRPETARA